MPSANQDSAVLSKSANSEASTLAIVNVECATATCGCGSTGSEPPSGLVDHCLVKLKLQVKCLLLFPFLSLDLSLCPDQRPRQLLIEFPSRGVGGTLCKFNASWYSDFPWLEYSVSRDTAHCFSCRRFGGLQNRSSNTFIDGFRNWRKAVCKFKKHSQSMIHKDTAVSWDQFRGTSREGANVAVQVSDTSRSEKQIVENRYYVKSIVEVLLLCAHQDIAIRGHDEKANSANPAW